MPDITIGSLCTGYGGLDLALEQFTGGRTVWVSDIDKHANQIIAKRFPRAVNIGDLKAIDWKQLRRVHWLTAGYPCQPFSNAGNRKGTDDPRHIWPWIAEGIRVARPVNILLENVRGHVKRGLDIVLGDLADMGYDTTWGVVRASEAGAPHRRERVFIVASDTTNHGLQRGWATRDGWDGPADGGLATPDPTCDGWDEGWTEPAGLVRGPDAPERRGAAPADAGSERLGQHPGEPPEEEARAVASHFTHGDCGLRADTDWGPYAPAIARWESITRPAPDPTEPTGRGGAHRLSPKFVEWMMGLPVGWVTDIDIPRNAQLKALGNGVVPQQALLALNALSHVTAGAVA